jgi:hypothetical protein
MILKKVQSGIKNADDSKGPVLTVEVPQVESLAEAQELYKGSEDLLLAKFNAALKQDATQGPKQPLRAAWIECGEDAESEVWLEAVTVYTNAVPEFRPTGRKGGTRPGGITRAEERSRMDRLAEQDPEEYARIMDSLAD